MNCETMVVLFLAYYGRVSTLLDVVRSSVVTQFVEVWANTKCGASRLSILSEKDLEVSTKCVRKQLMTWLTYAKKFPAGRSSSKANNAF